MKLFAQFVLRRRKTIVKDDKPHDSQEKVKPSRKARDGDKDVEVEIVDPMKDFTEAEILLMQRSVHLKIHTHMLVRTYERTHSCTCTQF